jgi:hypothetical protein
MVVNLGGRGFIPRPQLNRARLLKKLRGRE